MESVDETQVVVALIEDAPGVVKLTVVAPGIVDMLEGEAKVAEIEDDMHGVAAQLTVAAGLVDGAVQVVRVVVRGVAEAEVTRVMGGEEGRASSATTCHKSTAVIHPWMMFSVCCLPQCSGSITFWCGSGSGSADPCL